MADNSAPTPEVAPAPVPAEPAPAPVSDPTPTPEDSGSAYQGLGEDFDDADQFDDLGPETTPSPAPAEGEQPEPAEAATKDAAASEAQPKPDSQAKPPEAPATEGPKEQAPAEPTSPPSEPTQQDLLAQLQEKRTEVLEQLATNKFAFSKEEEKELLDGLDTDATKAIMEGLPKMKAQVYYEAVTTALHHIQQTVPAMIVETVKAMNKAKEAEDAFYGAFPAIDRTKHGEAVHQFASITKQQNPKISPEDLRAVVGAAVMARFGLQNPAAANGANPPPPQRNPAPPFVPAQSGASVRVTQEPANPWAGLGEDHDED